MKKIYSLLLSIAMLSGFTACTNEVDDVFDKSSAERMQETIEKDSQVLTSASNGWIMKYYADSQYGGYNLHVKFNADSTVSVQNELYGDSVITSHYSVCQSQGAVLSFDSYNFLIHMFSDPESSVSGVGTDGKGMYGDFEFRILSASADSVVMKGKKHGSRIVMVPMSSGTSWSDFRTKIKANESDINGYTGYKLIIGTDTMKMTRKYHQFSFTDPDGNTVNMPYILTEQGEELYYPVTCLGKTITGFNYSADGEWTSFTDSSVKIIPSMSLVSLFAANDWYMTLSGFTSTKYWDYWNTKYNASLTNAYGAVNALAFTPLSDTSGSVTNFYCIFGKYGGYLTYNLTAVSDTEVKMTFAKTGNSNGVFLYNNYGFVYLMAPFTGKTFKIAVDDVKKPTVMTLTDESDASNVITLYAAKKSDPMNN